MKSAALVLLATGIVLGASMVQTDWSNGPSGEITTTDWGSSFGSCLGMGWQAPGVLTLGTAMKWSRVYDNGSAFLLSAATVNSDAYTDLFKCSSSSIGAILSTGNQNQWSHQTVGFADSLKTVFSGDVNGDGLDEVFGGSDSLLWWENPGNPGWDWQKRLIGVIGLRGGVIYDYDGDGENDIICSYNSYSPTTANLTLFRNLGDGLAWETDLLYAKEGTATGSELSVAEITGDGYLTAVKGHPDSRSWGTPTFPHPRKCPLSSWGAFSELFP